MAPALWLGSSVFDKALPPVLLGMVLYCMCTPLGPCYCHSPHVSELSLQKWVCCWWWLHALTCFMAAWLFRGGSFWSKYFIKLIRTDASLDLSQKAKKWLKQIFFKKWIETLCFSKVDSVIFRHKKSILMPFSNFGGCFLVDEFSPPQWRQVISRGTTCFDGKKVCC